MGEGEGRVREVEGREEERRFGMTFPYFGEGIKMPTPSESNEEPIGKNVDVEPWKIMKNVPSPITSKAEKHWTQKVTHFVVGAHILISSASTVCIFPSASKTAIVWLSFRRGRLILIYFFFCGGEILHLLAGKASDNIYRTATSNNRLCFWLVEF